MFHMCSVLTAPSLFEVQNLIVENNAECWQWETQESAGNMNALPSNIIVFRENPHTDKGGLPFRTMGVANTALTRPAVLWTVEEMNKGSEARKLTSKRKRRS